MGVKLQAASGGSIELLPTNTASVYSVTLPAATTTMVGTDTTQTLTNKTLGSGLVAGASLITSGTAVASTSGTSIDFTGIPSWAKRITVMFNGVSTSGTAYVIIQLGYSSGVETSGYSGAVAQMPNASTAAAYNFTSGFIIDGGTNAAAVRAGAATISLLSSSTNLWAAMGCIGRTDAATSSSFGGTKALTGTLDRVRITTSNGTDTFDAGSINILYE